jgi:hypothetical protein
MAPHEPHSSGHMHAGESPPRHEEWRRFPDRAAAATEEPSSECAFSLGLARRGGGNDSTTTSADARSIVKRITMLALQGCFNLRCRSRCRLGKVQQSIVVRIRRVVVAQRVTQRMAPNSQMNFPSLADIVHLNRQCRRHRLRHPLIRAQGHQSSPRCPPQAIVLRHICVNGGMLL